MHRDCTLKKGWLAALFAVALCVLCAWHAPTMAHAEPVNLAQGKTARADSQEANSVRAELAVDGDNTGSNSRWGSARDEKSPHDPHWIYVDLASEEQVKTVKVFWENRKATKYKVQYAVGDAAPEVTSDAWKDIKVSTAMPTQKNEVFTLDTPVTARYVRLYIEDFQAQDPDDASKSWPTVSIYELEVYGEGGSGPSEQDPTANVARGRTGGQSDSENNDLVANKLFDGDTTSQASRWASRASATAQQDGGSHWVYVDLGQERTVKTVRLYWEQRKAKGYKIQIATGATVPSKEADWKTVYTNSGRPEKKTDTITLDAPKTARFVRLYIDNHTHADPDGGTAWGTVSLYEMEVYGGIPAMSLSELADSIKVPSPAPGAKTLTVQYPDYDRDAFEVSYNGTDYEQVVGAPAENGDIPIYQPIVNVQVKVSFKVKDKKSGQYAFSEISVTIPGANQVAEGDNAAPVVVPELREWKGGTGVYTVAAGARVLYADASLKYAAEALAADYTDLFGKKLVVAQGAADAAKAGDIVLTLASDASKGLGEEGYLMQVTDRIEVTASHKTGAYWSTRTILQALKVGNGSINQGTARDYPLYKVRGFMLDVGRKTFTLDFLKQMAEEMAWYKLNDFHVHLNDNYIWVEEYTDETVDEAYSGFRLESDIKKGTDGGKNKADLTSTDVFYTKDEFRAFIKDCREMGVNVVPEFDMPAHSLAFTKVRPDLRTPNSAMLAGRPKRGNDHLNLLAGKYDETKRFALSVWDEYLDGSDPVFDKDTVVHIGADEFDADGNQYRKFVNDLFAHMEEKGRDVRVWGSLTTIKGDGSVKVSGVNEQTGKRRQINLWNAGWANMREMYDLGFELINCNDTQYYIVPNGGYYHSTGLDLNTVYNNPLNTIGGTTIPAGDEQMAGGMFAIWNDMIGKKDNGMSEYDIYELIHESAGLYASASWGKGARSLDAAKQAVVGVGSAPHTNFGYAAPANEAGVHAQWNMSDLADASGLGNDLVAGKNAKIVDAGGKRALELVGGESWVKVNDDSALKTVGLNSSLRVKVKRMSAEEGPQVLFSSPYGQIMAVQEGTGKVGFTRENRAYSFDYELPVGVWVELELKNEKGFTSLYVDGTFVQKLGEAGDTKLKATCMFPVQYIGATENAFKGYVDDVRVTRNDGLAGEGESAFTSTIELDGLARKARGILESQKADAEASACDLAALVDEAQALLDQASPSADAVADVSARLKACMETQVYPKADYTDVDAIISALPSREALLTVYGEDSVAALFSLIDSLDRSLPASLQDEVDAFERQLMEARENLEPKSEVDLFADGLKANACTERPSAPASQAVDGDNDTRWHTRLAEDAGGVDNHDGAHWINLKLKAPATVTGLKYVPRQDNTENGRLVDYRVDVSTDNGATYAQVAKGTVASPAEISLIGFDAQKNVTDVKLWFDKAQPTTGANANKFASASEIAVRVKDETVDIEGLKALISHAEGLKEGSYTAETWAKLRTALANAKKVAAADAPTFEAVDGAKADLAAALTALVPGDAVDPGPNPDPSPGPNPDPQPDPNPQPEPDPNPQPDPDPDPQPEPDPSPNPEPAPPSGDADGPSNPGASAGSGSKPDSALPTTGDDSMIPVVLLGAVAVVAVVAGVVMRRRK